MTIPDRPLNRAAETEQRQDLLGRNTPAPPLLANATRPRLLARWVRVRMASAMTTSDLKVSDCTVLQYFDGRDPGDTIDVYNTKTEAGDEGTGGSGGGSGGSGETYQLTLASGQVLWCVYNNGTGHYFALLGGGAGGSNDGCHTIAGFDFHAVPVNDMVAGRDYVLFVNGDTGCINMSPTTEDCCGGSGGSGGGG